MFSCCLGGEAAAGAPEVLVNEEKKDDRSSPNTAAESEVVVKAGAQEDNVQKQFMFDLHSATLDRSFAKIGWMDPYAIILVDGKEIERTKPATGAHKKPVWEAQHKFEAGETPAAVTVQVWDKNNFHKDVFCGAVTVPCDEDMGVVLDKDFLLTKKGKPTGHVSLSLSVTEVGGPRAHTEKSISKINLVRQVSLGGELDNIMAVVHQESQKVEGGAAAVKFQEVDHPSAGDDAGDAQPEVARVRSDPKGKGAGAALVGSWKCVDTFGLEDFLKATGVGVFQRKIAMAAAWPSWDFTSAGTDKLKFVNHSAIGDLIEEIPIGTTYQWKDGHKNDYSCTAEWQKTADGGTLMVKREGKVGNYTEERKVAGDKLEFVLVHSTGVKWGRSFVRVLA